jgi:uncharacterized membrane protein
LRYFWQGVRSSFWFVPTVLVGAAVGLATVLIAVDANIDLQADKAWPLVFGAGAEGARGLLTAVSSSMITVAALVFSITIVAFSLTSSQYTSRVLRNFMRDHVNQIVLGVFVGIFAYCLVVLRTIRGGDGNVFVPSLSVLMGLILAFVGIGFLIYFIHHIAMSIQASNIIATAANETIWAVDHLFPQQLGDDEEADDQNPCMSDPDRVWISIAARNSGYIETVNGEGLLDFAREHETVVRMERGIGEFVAKGVPLV